MNYDSTIDWRAVMKHYGNHITDLNMPSLTLTIPTSRTNIGLWTRSKITLLKTAIMINNQRLITADLQEFDLTSYGNVISATDRFRLVYHKRGNYTLYDLTGNIIKTITLESGDIYPNMLDENGDVYYCDWKSGLLKVVRSNTEDVIRYGSYITSFEFGLSKSNIVIIRDDSLYIIDKTDFRFKRKYSTFGLTSLLWLTNDYICFMAMSNKHYLYDILQDKIDTYSYPSMTTSYLPTGQIILYGDKTGMYNNHNQLDIYLEDKLNKDFRHIVINENYTRAEVEIRELYIIIIFYRQMEEKIYIYSLKNGL